MTKVSEPVLFPEVAKADRLEAQRREAEARFGLEMKTTAEAESYLGLGPRAFSKDKLKEPSARPGFYTKGVTSPHWYPVAWLDGWRAKRNHPWGSQGWPEPTANALRSRRFSLFQWQEAELARVSTEDLRGQPTDELWESLHVAVEASDAVLSGEESPLLQTMAAEAGIQDASDPRFRRSAAQVLKAVLRARKTAIFAEIERRKAHEP